jgi:hypothetical protein
MAIIIISFSFFLISQLGFAFNSPTNSILTLRLVNDSTETLIYEGVTETNLGNSFVITPKVILPGGAATITGITTPYTDLAGKMSFRDNKNYTHLLHIIDPRMINFKEPIFSIYNENLISFVKPSSFKKNEIQSPDSIAYSSATVVIEESIKPDKDHVIT